MLSVCRVVMMSMLQWRGRLSQHYIVTSYTMEGNDFNISVKCHVPLSTAGLVAIILVPQRVEIADELVERSEDEQVKHSITRQ